jgi:predicted RNase H-like HicB family nuclease
MKYLVVIEECHDGFGAYVPDLPGCVAVGASVQEVLALMAEAIDLHIDSMLRDGEPLPPPSSRAALLKVRVS